MSSRPYTLTLTVLVIALAAATVSAQAPTFALELRAGYAGATNELGRTPVLNGQGYVTFDKRSPGPLFGVAGLVNLNELWALRVFFDHAPDTDIEGVWRCAPFVACPSVLIEPHGQLRRSSLGADVRLEPGVPMGPIQPVVFVGGGVRTQRLRWDSPVDEVSIPVAFEDTEFIGRAGVGLSGVVGPVELFGEAEGTLGAFGASAEQYIEGLIPDGRNTGFDVGVTAGVRLGIG